MDHARGDLRMEAVLILSELGDATAAAELKRIATDDDLAGDELREAATWGLGKAGCRAYAELLQLLSDDDDAVALHAICAFGSDVPEVVVRSLVAIVQFGQAREQSAASEALRLIGSDSALHALVDAARSREGARPWVLATLGRLDPIDVRLALDEDALLAEVEPLLTIGPDENWVASTEVAEDLRFLLKQNIV